MSDFQTDLFSVWPAMRFDGAHFLDMVIDRLILRKGHIGGRQEPNALIVECQSKTQTLKYPIHTHIHFIFKNPQFLSFLVFFVLFKDCQCCLSLFFLLVLFEAIRVKQFF